MCLDIHGTISLVQDVLNVFVDLSTAIIFYLSIHTLLQYELLVGLDHFA